MTTKQVNKKDKTPETLKLIDFAELNKVRYSTIKYYSELGLLPYEKKGGRLARYYPVKEASKRLKEILALKAKGKSIPAIINELIKK